MNQSIEKVLYPVIASVLGGLILFVAQNRLAPVVEPSSNAPKQEVLKADPNAPINNPTTTPDRPTLPVSQTAAMKGKCANLSASSEDFAQIVKEVETLLNANRRNPSNQQGRNGNDELAKPVQKITDKVSDANLKQTARIAALCGSKDLSALKAKLSGQQKSFLEFFKRVTTKVTFSEELNEGLVFQMLVIDQHRNCISKEVLQQAGMPPNFAALLLDIL